LTEKVTFIDFEFAAYNYQAHDIAMHFCDYPGGSISCSKIIEVVSIADFLLSWL